MSLLGVILFCFITLTLKVNLLLSYSKVLLFALPKNGERFDISKIFMGWENIDAIFTKIHVLIVILASKSHLSTTLLASLLICLS